MDSHPDSVAALVDLETERYSQPLAIRLFSSKTGAEFDVVLEELLELAVQYLEANANFLIDRSEDSITCDLVAFAQIPGILSVTQQTHSNGHVDITIRSIGRSFQWLGEAKIYDGPKYHVDGLQQLVTRYSTGRQRSGILVEYVKKSGIKNLVAAVKKYMDAEKPCSQDGEAQDHRIHWAFTTMHLHSSGELLRVLHLSCNLYRNPSDGAKPVVQGDEVEDLALIANEASKLSESDIA